jgi:hypothetical protein
MIALDPQETVDFSLDVDAAKPAHNRPTFVAKFMTGREEAKVQRLWREATQKEGDERLDLLAQAAAVGLVGWRNVSSGDGRPILFDPLKLPDIVTISGLSEILSKMCTETALKESDKKKSALSQASSPAT